MALGCPSSVLTQRATRDARRLPWRRWVASAAALSVAFGGGLQAQEPRIDITLVPAYGGSGLLQGRVTNADPAAHRVAGYLFIEGSGWWVKPYGDDERRCTPIASDGSFQIDVDTGGVDNLATRYAVFLLPNTEDCPPLGQAPMLPDALLARPSDFLERTPFPLEFSNHLWIKRNSPYPGGPSPRPGNPPGNCFLPENVFRDSDGHLHLRLVPTEASGSCTAPDRAAELWLSRSLGYGEYRFHTIGRVDTLHPSTVFGMFTWDPVSGPFNREMDIELGRWCVPTDSNNAQFVVQPYGAPGHLFRFPISLTDEASELTFLMDWRPGVVAFSAYHGHHFGSPPPQDLVAQHTFTDGIPSTGREQLRINLWRACELAPAQEVILTHFSHRPAPERFYSLPPCRIIDTRATASPVAANATRTFSVSGRCGIPADARAVAGNLVAVSPGGSGHFTLYPTGLPVVPAASSLNFSAGRTRANNTIVALGSDGKLTLNSGAPASTHFVFDVSGYFR